MTEGVPAEIKTAHFRSVTREHYHLSQAARFVTLVLVVFKTTACLYVGKE
jgi:hypothetical protein